LDEDDTGAGDREEHNKEQLDDLKSVSSIIKPPPPITCTATFTGAYSRNINRGEPSKIDTWSIDRSIRTFGQR
jgi:hypothetical protein